MSLKIRLLKIEARIEELEEIDIDDVRLVALYEEADLIADEMTGIQDNIERQIKERERIKAEANAEIMRDILELEKAKKWDLMVERYGGEFIDEYDIQGNTVISHAKRGVVGSWTVSDTKKKLKKLLIYRIYDTYVR